jgi:hypothetical protein
MNEATNPDRIYRRCSVHAGWVTGFLATDIIAGQLVAGDAAETVTDELI